MSRRPLQPYLAICCACRVAQFVTLMAHKMADVRSESSLKASFALFDHSGDGFIDAAEMRNLMINVGEPVTIEDVNELLKEVDRDGDGVVNYSEFTKVVCAERMQGGSSSSTAETAAAGGKKKKGGRRKHPH